MVEFGVLNVALTTAKQLTRSEDADLLTTLLELTQGKQGDAPYYRPFYVAARYQETNPERVTVLGGGSDRLEYAQFSVETLLAMQGAEDERLALVVPEMYQVKPPAAPLRRGSVSLITRTVYD